MVLDDVFEFLRRKRIVHNHAMFSTDFLGHSPRYYDYLRCSDVEPSLKSLLRLAVRLNKISVKTGLDMDENEAGQLAQRVLRQAFNSCG